MSELTHESVSEPLSEDGGVVEVRRNAGLVGGIGGAAAVVAILYLSRATSTGGWLDWVLCLVMAGVAAAYLQGLVDARTPLLVADVHGIRVRQGRTWHGVPWSDVEAVEHRARRGPLADGWLEVFPRDGAPVAVPLSMSTRAVGDGGDLAVALGELAPAEVEVVELVDEAPDEAPDVAPDADESADPAGYAEPEAPAAQDDTFPPAEPTAPWRTTSPPTWTPGPLGDEQDPPTGGQHDGDGARMLRDPRPVLARGIGTLAARLRRPQPAPPGDAPAGPAASPAAGGPSVPLVASLTPSPLRDPVGASRIEIRSDLVHGANALRLDPAETEDGTRSELPEARELRRPGSVNLVEDVVLLDANVRPIAQAGQPVEPLVIDGTDVEPAADPVIGPDLAAARTRLGLSVDQLADRTRIRPHVIESIEVDDFAPCGGDFYARGHLRTLARVLGIDGAPLLATYDERYAHAPISPRRVFEAELATGAHGGIRGTRGGPNWSVLVAAVMVLVLAWSIARLVTDSPSSLNDAPPLNGSGGIASAPGDPVPVLLDAAGGGATVRVQDGSGTTVFDGDLAFGQTRLLRSVATPVTVTSTDGSLKVTLGDGETMSVGDTGARGTRTFGPAR